MLHREKRSAQPPATRYHDHHNIPPRTMGDRLQTSICNITTAFPQFRVQRTTRLVGWYRLVTTTTTTTTIYPTPVLQPRGATLQLPWCTRLEDVAPARLREDDGNQMLNLNGPPWTNLATNLCPDDAKHTHIRRG